MYKFEISADSPEELQEKIMDFALSTRGVDKNQPSIPQYIDEDPMDFKQTVESRPIREMIEFPKIVYPHALDAFPKSETPPVQSIPTAQEVDARGMPYDARIHSASKSLTKDGSWRYMRGVDDKTIEQIETELRGQSKKITQPVPPPPAPTVAVEMPTFQKPVEIVKPVEQPKYENIAIPNVTRPAFSLESFKNNLMILMATLINEKKIDHDYVQQLKEYFGVKEIWNILGNEKQCMELYKTFGECGFITRID